jgi:glycosyltransferase involved in cell wall biosynthesis
VDVFQSEYIRGVFRQAGYAKPGSHVIANGTDEQVFRLRDRAGWRAGSPLKIFSCTFTTRASKRFDIVAQVSELPGVESFHIGSWPAGLDSRRVTLLGRKSPAECAALYRDEADLLLHPAERDICPNVVVEALSSGLPVLFGTHGGTAEIVRDCGVAIDGPPADAVDQARMRYPELVARVRDAHHRFSIARAAQEYAVVFTEALRGRAPSPVSE